jgi:glycosyltransferase involved in cell wall biosynthesis
MTKFIVFCPDYGTRETSGATRYLNSIIDTLRSENDIEIHSASKIQTVTGFFLWEENGKILLPNKSRKFLYSFVHKGNPLLSIFARLFLNPSRIFGPDIKLKYDFEEHTKVICAYMPFNYINVSPRKGMFRENFFYILFMHRNDTNHRAVLSRIKNRNIISLSPDEISGGSENRIIFLPPYIPKIQVSQNTHDRKKTSTKLKFIWVGRYENSKNYELYQSIANTFFGKATFLAMGPGTEQFNFPIVGLGALGDQDYNQQFSDSDVLIHTGLHESFSYVIAEALSLGIPVIGNSRCEAVAQILCDSHAGKLANTLDEYIALVEEYVTNISLRNSLGEDGKNYANRFFTRDSFEQEVRSIFS